MNYFFSEVKKKKQHHITFAICFVQAVLTTFVSGTTFKEDRTFCALLASQRTSTFMCSEMHLLSRTVNTIV